MSSKAIPPFYQVGCFRMVWNMVRPVDSMNPLSHIPGCEVSSMVRSDAVWNTIAVDKTFYKYMDAVLVEALHAGFITIYFSEDKASVDLPIKEVVQCRQLPSRSLAGHLGMIPYQRVFLLLADVTLSSGGSRTSLGERKFLLLNLCTTSISPTLFLGPVG